MAQWCLWRDVAVTYKKKKKEKKKIKCKRKLRKTQMVYFTSLPLEWLPSLPRQRLVMNALDDTDFGGKVDFCGGRKIGEPLNPWDFTVRVKKTKY